MNPQLPAIERRINLWHELPNEFTLGDLQRVAKTTINVARALRLYLLNHQMIAITAKITGVEIHTKRDKSEWAEPVSSITMDEALAQMPDTFGTMDWVSARNVKHTTAARQLDRLVRLGVLTKQTIPVAPGKGKRMKYLWSKK